MAPGLGDEQLVPGRRRDAIPVGSKRGQPSARGAQGRSHQGSSAALVAGRALRGWQHEQGGREKEAQGLSRWLSCWRVRRRFEPRGHTAPGRRRRRRRRSARTLPPTCSTRGAARLCPGAAHGSNRCRPITRLLPLPLSAMRPLRQCTPRTRRQIPLHWQHSRR